MIEGAREEGLPILVLELVAVVVDVGADKLDPLASLSVLGARTASSFPFTFCLNRLMSTGSSS